MLFEPYRCFTEHPLASNFSILDGVVTVTVPDVEPADDYTIVCESSFPSLYQYYVC